MSVNQCHVLVQLLFCLIALLKAKAYAGYIFRSCPSPGQDNLTRHGADPVNLTLIGSLVLNMIIGVCTDTDVIYQGFCQKLMS